MKRIFFLRTWMSIVIGVCCGCLRVSAQEVIVRGEFESPLYVLGNLEGQGAWSVVSGNVQVVSGVQVRGTQSVSASDASYRLSISSVASVVWIDSWHRDAGSASQPLIPAEVLSGVICMSSTRGLLALDGDGEGNGIFISLGTTLPSDAFVRVTMRLDYTTARYDVWVNGELKASHLGFKNNTVTALSEISRETDGLAYLDALTVSTYGLDEDRDGDGVSDLDEASGHWGAVTSPAKADSDNDGYSDGDEWIMGSDPLSGASVFRPQYRLSPSGKSQFSIKARAGRSYTMQTSFTLKPNSWTDVPGAINITGADGEMLLIEDSNEPMARQFYRINIQYLP